MHFSSKPQMVRVDFFKESGEWYATEEMEWLHWEGQVLIHDAFILSLKKAFIDANGRPYFCGMTAVCLEPYHENAYPLMIKDWNNQRLISLCPQPPE